MSHDDWSHLPAICPTCHARLVSSALPYLFHLYKGALVVVGNVFCCSVSELCIIFKINMSQY